MLRKKAVPNQTLSRINSITNVNLPVLFGIEDSIKMDNIPNTAGWNAPPDHYRPPPYFTEGCKHSLLYLSPTLLIYCRRLDPKSKNFDSSLQSTCFHWSSFQSFWVFAYFSLFSLFPFRINGLVAATRPLKLFLIKLLRRVDEFTLGPDECVRCWARSLVDFFLSLEEVTLRNCSSDTDSFLGFPRLFCPRRVHIFEISQPQLESHILRILFFFENGLVDAKL